MYSGFYTLNDAEFLFTFDGERLSLLPKDSENEEAAMGLTHRKLDKGMYAYPGDPIAVDSPLVLSVHIQKRLLILYPTSIFYAVEDPEHGVLSAQIGSWFLVDRSKGISGLSIRSNVLDYAYDIQDAVDTSHLGPDGKIEIISTRKDGHSFGFVFKGIEVDGYLSHARGVSLKKGELPIKIDSQLSLSFQETSDFTFLQELVRMVHDYVAFIAQGYGYQYDDIKLLSRRTYKEASYLSDCAEYLENGRKRDCLSPKKLIAVSGASELSGCIFQAIADKKLVLEHLPAIDERASYNAARLIMMLAALDKTLEMIYEDGITHSAAALEARDAINDALNSLIGEETPGRIRREVTRLKRILNDSESLESRMSQFGKDHRELFTGLQCGTFSSHQQRTAFFGRITKVRNKIAHGNFDIIKDYSFEDIKGTNQFLLAAQLVLIGMERDDEVAAIVNEVY